ncbi:MAG: ribosome silencing factor [Gemmatimonadota bacterium]|nr:ribosome silencing factor [Gemmatimonadota bacterium]
MVADRLPNGSPDLLRWVVEAVDDLKANRMQVLDLRPVSDATDYFVIASGTSEGHVRGIADRVVKELGQRGVRPHHVEGVSGGRWVLLDFVDLVVHIFHPEARAFYRLERLWDDAPVVIEGP